MRKGRTPRLAFVAAVTAFFMAFAGIALADLVKNNVVENNTQGTGGVRTITEGGNTTVKYWIQENSGGGLQGCDASDGTPVTVNIITPQGVTATPSSLTFSACGNESTNSQSVTFSSSVVSSGSGHQITHTASDNAGNYNPSAADWKLVVEGQVVQPPQNQAPSNVQASFGGSVDCRQQATLTVTFSDSDSTLWSAQIDWDYDGTTFDVDTTLNNVESGFTANHTYNSPGEYTAAVRITDNQGATSAIATAQVTVTQEYRMTFLQPFDQSTPTTQYVINSAKAGRVVPVKVTIYDVCTQAQYAGTVAPTISFNKTATNGVDVATDAVELYADAGSSSAGTNVFRMADGFWIYNLDTSKGLTVGQTYRIDVYVGGVKATDDEFALLKTVK